MDILSVPLKHGLTVLCTSRANDEPICQVMAELALRGPVIALDGGNCFPAYRLLRLLRLRLPDPFEAGSRVFVQRAFTCYQMLSLLEGTPTLSHPHLLLDPFATFYDEQVPLPEIKRLFEGCLRQIERLRKSAPLLVALPPARGEERLFLMEQVCSIADRLYIREFPAPQAYQPGLF